MTNIIVLEGVDGSGKTSLSKSLKDILIQNGYSCQILIEPDKFKEVIKEPKENKLTNLFLFLASRCETIQQIKNTDVDFIILDRFYISTLVYQSLESGLSVEALSQLIAFSLQGIRADFIYYLNNSDEQIIKNLKEKGEFVEGDEYRTKVLKTIYHLINKFYLRNENITYLYEPQSTFLYQIIEDLRINGFQFKKISDI